MKKERLNTFLSKFPLYRSFEAVTDYTTDCEGYVKPTYIHEQTFDYFCENEQSVKTFEIRIPEYSLKYWERISFKEIPECVFNNLDKINYIQHFEGLCKSCNSYKIDLLIHVWSDKEIPKYAMHSAKHSMMDLIHENIIKPQSTEAKIFIEKVGVYPKIEIEVDKTLNKYFDRETRQWYYKALKSLNENLGIGAYAYFRRIIEKELIQIVKNISTDISNNSDKIKNLLTQFDKHNKVHLLYENIYQYLRNPSV